MYEYEDTDTYFKYVNYSSKGYCVKDKNGNKLSDFIRNSILDKYIGTYEGGNGQLCVKKGDLEEFKREIRRIRIKRPIVGSIVQKVMAEESVECESISEVQKQIKDLGKKLEEAKEKEKKIKYIDEVHSKIEKFLNDNNILDISFDVRISEPDCSICMSEVRNHKYKTKCNHIFHEECFDKFKKSTMDLKCPNCRTRLT